MEQKLLQAPKERKLKYTPGPWRVGIHGAVVSDTTKNLYILGSYGEDDFSYYGGYLICESVARGNAALLSLAPEMFELLSEYARRLPGREAGRIEELLERAKIEV